MKFDLKILAGLVALLISFNVAFGQTENKYSYQAQSAFIPREFSKIHLGMWFDQFAGAVDLRNAEVGDTRFDWLELKIPFEKAHVAELTVRIHG